MVSGCKIKIWHMYCDPVVLGSHCHFFFSNQILRFYCLMVIGTRYDNLLKTEKWMIDKSAVVSCCDRKSNLLAQNRAKRRHNCWPGEVRTYRYVNIGLDSKA